MSDLAERDYFSDTAVAQDPYDYWDQLRSRGPVVCEPHYGVVAVTGYAEVQAAFKDVASFSAVNAIGGPFPPLPFTPSCTLRGPTTPLSISVPLSTVISSANPPPSRDE